MAFNTPRVSHNPGNRFSIWNRSLGAAANFGAVGSIVGSLGIFANAKALSEATTEATAINDANALPILAALMGIFFLGVGTLWFSAAMMGFGFRAAQFVRERGATTRWRPGWAIGSWFIPILSQFVPFLIFRDIVAATKTSNTAATQRTLLWFWIWWVVLSGLSNTTVSSLQSSNPATVYSGLTFLAGVMCFHIVPFMMGKKLFKTIDEDLRAMELSEPVSGTTA
jgi:hypothetical protein